MKEPAKIKIVPGCDGVAPLWPEGFFADLAERQKRVQAAMDEMKRESDPYRNRPNWARPIG